MCLSVLAHHLAYAPEEFGPCAPRALGRLSGPSRAPVGARKGNGEDDMRHGIDVDVGIEGTIIVVVAPTTQQGTAGVAFA